MKILQLGKFYPVLGGVEKVMWDISTGLASRGIRCDMLCASASPGGGRTVSLGGASRLVCCRTWFKAHATMISPSMVTALRRLCHERGYDIIHVHHPDPMACLALLLSGYRGKVVLHWHSDIQKQKYLLRLYRPLQDWLLRRADLIIGTSPVYLRESPYLCDVQDKCRSLPIGVSPVVPREEDVASVRRRYPGKKIVFSLGRLVAYKGYVHLIEAARHLSDDYVVLIGGSGAMRNELEAYIESWEVGDNVKMLGRVPDEELPGYFGACDVFCLPSVMKTEAFGIVQIEAMSCGRPVVATEIPGSGVSWVNAHGVSGLNVLPSNGRALASAITEVCGNPESNAGFGIRARERYLRLFTKEMMIDNLQKIYKSL